MRTRGNVIFHAHPYYMKKKIWSIYIGTRGDNVKNRLSEDNHYLSGIADGKSQTTLFGHDRRIQNKLFGAFYTLFLFFLSFKA